jgi:DNA helicase-2/ATP-dependent DNA helicase PcrA
MTPVPGQDIFASLNAAQVRAVKSNADTVAILAGPGSGKTHTLTSRVVYLVDTLGYQPQDVIVATFTVKAAREMTERIGKALGHDREKKIILGTFHSVARRYLAAYGQRIGLNQKFGIADDGDSRAVIARICKRLQLTVDPPMARGWISKKKSKGTEPYPQADAKKAAAVKGPQLQELETLYQEYQDHLERSNLLDYDDLLVKCVELLRRHPSCVSNVQAVLIDEYQDTNGVQYELMKLFAQARQRITIVGDPDQSIYGWRSAEIRNLHRMLEEYPKTDQVALEENYRSSQSILDLSLTVIQQDTKRYKKVLRPIHNRGSRPVLRRLRTSAQEAEWIVSEIRRTLMMSGDMITHNDVAILLRSAALSRHIEHALGKAGMAYRMVGGFKFYERMEIKVLLDYLRVIHQPENNDALGRIMNVPKRGIGDVTVKALLEEAEKSSMSLYSLLDKHCRGDRIAKTRIMKVAEQKISGDLLRLIRGTRKRIEEISQGTPFGLVEMIEHVLTQLKFEQFIMATCAEDHETRWANVQEFIGLAGDFVKDLDKLGDDSLPNIDGLQQSKEMDVLPKFLSNVALASDVLKDGDAQQNKPLVTISTIHAAKGLEWPVVFVPSAYNGSIPHARAEDLDEERRLLYVAMTRAKTLLYLSCPLYGSAHGSGGEKHELSPFLSPVAKFFARKGPCFDRPVMSEVARILQRTLPADDTIYKSIPPMTMTDDDLFPEDPEEVAREVRKAGGAMEGFSYDGRRPKRPRLYGQAGSTSTDEEPPWQKEYVTTMDQASNFTVSKLPGFVSAASPQVALAAAAAEKAAQQKTHTTQITKKSVSNRPTNQKSIMGFVKTATSAPARLPTTRPSAPTTYKIPHVPNAAVPAPKTAIDPTLAAHKLGAASLSRPVQPKREPEEFKGKQYTCFSSSPTKPSVAEEDENEEPLEPTRPSGSLHATTMNMPKGLGGGFRRPAGLARDGGIAPMERLRKPFKPLTLNRN